MGAGRNRQFSFEDAACAGRYVHYVTKRLTSVELNDAAVAASLMDRTYGDDRARLLLAAARGRALRDAGFADELPICRAVDSYGIVAAYDERQITKLGPERGR